LTIPESQLDTWSHRSQTDTAIRAHAEIREVMRDPTYSSVFGINFSDYLQGSYRNYTNTVRDHDVDVVLQLNTSYTSDFSQISDQAAASIQGLEFPAVYSLTQFRPGVLAALRGAFGWENVVEGNKSIKVVGSPGVKLDADVVVCQQHRLYYSTYPFPQYHEGISFYHGLTGLPIINFPLQHYENGVAKHTATDGWFKHTVRIFKNARSYMAERDLLAAGRAPSYFLQGLLYNVPNAIFGGSTRQNFDEVLSWLLGNGGQLNTFRCQNGLIPLIGSSDEQWSEIDALRFIIALYELDRDWT
jgi:hypothetical protein